MTTSPARHHTVQEFKSPTNMSELLPKHPGMLPYFLLTVRVIQILHASFHVGENLGPTSTSHAVHTVYIPVNITKSLSLTQPSPTDKLLRLHPRSRLLPRISTHRNGPIQGGGCTDATRVVGTGLRGQKHIHVVDPSVCSIPYHQPRAIHACHIHICRCVGTLCERGVCVQDNETEGSVDHVFDDFRGDLVDDGAEGVLHRCIGGLG